MAVPAILEQVLFEERVFRIEDQNLRTRLKLFEIVSNQRSALVGPRWAAERVRRGDNDEKTAVLHAFQLPSQQLGLRASIPRVRDGLRCGLVIALYAVVFEGDARSDDGPVVRKLGAACQRHGPCYRVHRYRRIVDDVDAVCFRERLIIMGERFERAHAREIEIAEEARRVFLFRLEQCYVEFCRGGYQIFGDGRAANAAPDHDDPCLGLASRRPGVESRDKARSGQAAKLSTRPCHCRLLSFARAARYSASVAVSASLSCKATACMIELERVPDLKAAIASASFSLSIPTIAGMPLSPPSRRWQDAHMAASWAPRSLSAVMPLSALRMTRPRAMVNTTDCDAIIRRQRTGVPKSKRRRRPLARRTRAGRSRWRAGRTRDRDWPRWPRAN